MALALGPAKTFCDMKCCGAAVDLGGDYKSPTPSVCSLRGGQLNGGLSPFEWAQSGKPRVALVATRKEPVVGPSVDQRGLPKLLEHGYARPQVLRLCRLGTNNQRPKASGTFIDVQLKGAFQYPTSS